MKIAQTLENGRSFNFRLLQYSGKTNLSIQDDGELFLQKEYSKSDGINSTQIIIITSTDINTSEINDWFVVEGVIYRCDSSVDMKQLDTELKSSFKIIASNIPLITPKHLISHDDLKYIVKYWNNHKTLPNGDIKEFTDCLTDCDGSCGSCANLGLIVEYNNNYEIIIEWDKEIETMNNVADVCDETPRSKSFNSIHEAFNSDRLPKGLGANSGLTEQEQYDFLHSTYTSPLTQIRGEAENIIKSRFNETDGYHKVIYKEAFINGAKSESAKQFHQKGLYDDDEVLQLLLRATTENYDNLYDWFQKLKKQ